MAVLWLLCLLLTGGGASRLPGPDMARTGQGNDSRPVDSRGQSSRKHDLAGLCKDCVDKVVVDGPSRDTLTEPAVHPDVYVAPNRDSTVRRHKVRKHNGSRRALNKRRRVDPARTDNSTRHHTRPRIRIKIKRTKSARRTFDKDVIDKQTGGQDDEKRDASTDGERWSRTDLNQVPDVARLERRLHPTVTAPVRDILQSVARMLEYIQRAVRRNEADYMYMFNSTRFTIMMGVRRELPKVAEQNNKVYDAVMEASLLTKYIYLRAHERHRLGYSTDGEVPAAAAFAATTGSIHRIGHIDTRKHFRKALEELRKAERLKQKVLNRQRNRRPMPPQSMTVERRSVEKIDTRGLRDLARWANDTIRTLTAARPRLHDKLRFYSHMHRGDKPGFTAARNLSDDAKDCLKEARKQFMLAQKASGEIGRHLREHAHGPQADMPFDDHRLMLWAAVDRATKHADHLYMAAAHIHGSLHDIVLKAKDAISKNDKGTMGKALEYKAAILAQQIKAIDRVLDGIRVVIGDADILRDRCDDIEGSGSWTGDDEDKHVIDCDAYLTTEGSGDDLEGSGEIEATAADIYLLNHEQLTPIVPKPAMNTDITERKGDKTESRLINNQEVITITNTKSKVVDTGIETTTHTPTTVIDESAETDDFTFTDFFGLLSDDPDAAEYIYEDPNAAGRDAKPRADIAETMQSRLNKLILMRLDELIRVSKGLNENASKTADRLKGLRNSWEVVEERFRNVSNNIDVGRAFIHEWHAKQLLSIAVHDRVTDVTSGIKFKIPILEEKCAKVATEADDKVKEVDRLYKERQEKQTSDTPTATDGTEAVGAVKQVKQDVEELVELTQIHPDPCNAAYTIYRRMKANITELKLKIEKAKLIASSIQRAVSMTGKGYISVPMDAPRGDEAGLTSSVEIGVKMTDVDGPIVVVETKQTGSLVVSVENGSPSVTVLDADNDVIGEVASSTEMATGTWYRILVERAATSYTMYVHGAVANTTDVSNVTVSDQHAVQPAPSSVYLGGAPDGYPGYVAGLWQGCIGYLMVDGRFVNTGYKDSAGNMPSGCVGIREDVEEGNIVLGGGGFVSFSLPTILERTSDIRHIQLTFRAYSDGLLFSFRHMRRRSLGTVTIQSGRILLAIKHSLGEATMASNDNVYIHGVEYHLEIKLERNIRGPGSVVVLLNGDHAVFTQTNEKVTSTVSSDGLFLGGVPTNHNRSLSVCIQSVQVNDKQIEFFMLENSVDAYYGSCKEWNCVELTNVSKPIELEDALRDEVYMSFMYGSSGPLVQYSKGEKYKITVAVDEDGLQVSDSVDGESHTIPLSQYHPGERVIVTVKDADKRASVACAGETVEFKYGGFFSFWDSDDKDEHKLTIGGSSNQEATFVGKIDDLIINQQSFDTSHLLASNNLKRCSAVNRRPEQKTDKTQNDFVC